MYAMCIVCLLSLRRAIWAIRHGTCALFSKRRTINNRRKDGKMLRLKTASKSHTFAYFLTQNGLIWAFDFLSVQKPLASAYAANADKFLNIPWSQYSRHLTIVAHVFMK